MQPHARRIAPALALSLNATTALCQTQQFEPEPARPWHYHLSGTMTAIAACNIDGDADLKRITADETTIPGSITISVHDPLPGGGDSFTQTASFPQTSFEPTPIELELIDLDDDGDLDLMGQCRNSSVDVLLASGGTFTQSRSTCCR